MDEKTVLYQLMGMRMNSVMNGITEQDEDYQAPLRESDECFGRLESLHLPNETMKLIDRYGALAYTLGFSDCRELLLGTSRLGKEAAPGGLL